MSASCFFPATSELPTESTTHRNPTCSSSVMQTFRTSRWLKPKPASGPVSFFSHSLDSGLEAHLLLMRNVEFPEALSPLEELREDVPEGRTVKMAQIPPWKWSHCFQPLRARRPRIAPRRIQDRKAHLLLRRDVELPEVLPPREELGEHVQWFRRLSC